MADLCAIIAYIDLLKNIQFAHLPCQRHPNFRQLRAQDCGWAPGLPACSPCGATPPQCVSVLWGRPMFERVPAPGTPSCRRLESRADPGPQPVSSWTRWRPSHSAAGSGTETTWHIHKGAMMETVSGRKGIRT